MDCNISVSIKRFRAIENAYLELNGITVVSGVNSCGKSTISKLLDSSFHYINNFDELINENLRNDLNEYFSLFRVMQDSIRRVGKKLNFEFELFSFLRFGLNDFDRIFKCYDSLAKDFTEAITNSKHRNIAQKAISRVIEISKSLIKGLPPEISYDECLIKIRTNLNGIYEKYSNLLQDREINYFKNKLMRIFEERVLPKEFTLKEYGEEILNLKDNSISVIHSIKNSIYIDTPMVVGDFMTTNPHRTRLSRYLGQSALSQNDEISEILDISKDIIHGESSFKNDESKYSGTSYEFKSYDGSTYNLTECATGIKSFSIIQLLLKNGSINKNTLLIIDEPEVHLHPQWIIEYARLIVMLNKHLGVKFFIASHSPDMISAIKYIAKKEFSKEDFNKNLNYYLAEPEEKKYTFTYKSLGTNIEPIFESFNIAFDRMDRYGNTEED